MTLAAESIAIRAPVKRVFDVLTDFENYPEHQPSVEKTEVLKRTKTVARVAFTLHIVTKVHYVLDFRINYPRSITWKSVEGDSFVKGNTGSWKVTALEKNLTDLECEMDVQFGIWIPHSLSDNLMNSYFPDMLKHFKLWAEGKKKKPRG